MDKIIMSAKAVGKNGASIKTLFKGATLYQARQDTGLIGQLDQMYVSGVFDGHSNYGAECSTQTAKFFWDYLVENKSNMISLLSDDKSAEVKTMIENAFQTVNCQMTKKPNFGTTASLAIIFQIQDKKILIKANVGDSPIFGVKTCGEVFPLYQNQTCDSLESFQMYIDHQVKNKEKILEPVLSICHNLKAPVDYKAEWPPKLFLIDEDMKASVRPDAAELVRQIIELNFLPHYNQEFIEHLLSGTQTIRKNTYTHPLDNFGSHLGSIGTQMVSSIGDKSISSCIPYVEIEVILPETQALLLFSDGIDDFIEDYQELAHLVNLSPTAEDLWHNMISYIDLKCTNPNSKHFIDKGYKTTNGFFKHDDCALIMIKFESK